MRFYSHKSPSASFIMLFSVLARFLYMLRLQKLLFIFCHRFYSFLPYPAENAKKAAHEILFSQVAFSVIYYAVFCFCPFSLTGGVSSNTGSFFFYLLYSIAFFLHPAVCFRPAIITAVFYIFPCSGKSFPQFSQTHSRFRFSAASCR